MNNVTRVRLLCERAEKAEARFAAIVRICDAHAARSMPDDSPINRIRKLAKGEDA